MNPNEINRFKKAERTEEVQYIIERMPKALGLKVSAFILFLVIVFFCFGWIIKYPDVVSGSIIINASSAPVKLVANSRGKLQLKKLKNFTKVHEGEYLAYIQNSANVHDVQNVAKIVTTEHITHENFTNLSNLLPKNPSLGELNGQYFRVLNTLNQFNLYTTSNLYDKQIEILEKLSTEYQQSLVILEMKRDLSLRNLKIANKFRTKDSLLFSKAVVSEAENDRSAISLLSAQESYQTMLSSLSSIRIQLQQSENQIGQIQMQKLEKEKQLRLELLNSLVDLEDNIKTWEDKYVFKSPITGTVQFMKFWTNDQFIESGETIFTIVPLEHETVGQLTLPALGAGKVKEHQQVIIKLDDYPYNEYGSVTGNVSAINLTTNKTPTKDGTFESYLVEIDLPNDLTTNYGKKLPFKFEIKGTGDIITNQRRLLERLFDNLNYKFNE